MSFALVPHHTPWSGVKLHNKWVRLTLFSGPDGKFWEIRHCGTAKGKMFYILGRIQGEYNPVYGLVEVVDVIPQTMEQLGDPKNYPKHHITGE